MRVNPSKERLKRTGMSFYIEFKGEKVVPIEEWLSVKRLKFGTF